MSDTPDFASLGSAAARSTPEGSIERTKRAAMLRLTLATKRPRRASQAPRITMPAQKPRRAKGAVK